MLVTVFDPLTGAPLVLEGGAPTAEDDPLNKLTPVQWDFHLARQDGVAGSVPRAIIGRFTGPAYPFGPSWALTLGPKTDLEVIFTNVVNIITIPIGSLPFAPFDGSEVPNLVFEPNDAITQGLIRYFIRRELRAQEPRAVVLSVRTIVPENEPHTIVVTISFQIVGDPEGRVFSAPVEFNTLSLAA